MEDAPFAPEPPPAEASASEVQVFLCVDVVRGAISLTWRRLGSEKVEWVAQLQPCRRSIFPPAIHLFELLEREGAEGEWAFRDRCGTRGTSMRAFCKRIARLHTPEPPAMKPYYCPDGEAAKPTVLPVPLAGGVDAWAWFSDLVAAYAGVLVFENPDQTPTPERVASAARALLPVLESGAFARPPRKPPKGVRVESQAVGLGLRVVVNIPEHAFEFFWTKVPEGKPAARGVVTCPDAHRVRWEYEPLGGGGENETVRTKRDGESIRVQLQAWLSRHPVSVEHFGAWVYEPGQYGVKKLAVSASELGEKPGQWILDQIEQMAEALALIQTGKRAKVILPHFPRPAEPERPAPPPKPKSPEKAVPSGDRAHPAPVPPPAPVRPQPPIPVRLNLPEIPLVPGREITTDLAGFFLREKAALWWVSNQSDNLLCLPSCRIRQLDYQVRTALRVLGPLRGRALLSDEVGLGKTIEAGLVISELLTRGMARRVLILTLPSLVDQWAEELDDKFGLTAATSNQGSLRSDPASFWADSACVVASLHTAKQPAQLAHVAKQSWDIVVVDEAHHLRNQRSQAWQAVNTIPRQFLLLLTATPVQNSLEELYNLVTLLQPGHLPPPKEFRARFIDPERPRHPKEPDELRRLLGQVMIRNTRSNAGIDLPPRHAETVMLTPAQAERETFVAWEAEFRRCLSALPVAQASLWGRLLLAAVGSSPAAFEGCLSKFPDREAAARWRGLSLCAGSWEAKCRLLLPLARLETGVVVFTQFLDTQAALQQFLQADGVAVHAINGSTPAARRQPITEEFQRRGGVLLLTHSGTEGRNLQFCNQLANVDLPWNPMEIEQRIGRLHRLGQTRPVRIHNFVQEGTLQEHLLEILQEKLNLFELVVGEVGLVLGDRYSGEEFEEELFRRWQSGEGRLAEEFDALGREILAAREQYGEVKQLDDTLFSKDFEAL